MALIDLWRTNRKEFENKDVQQVIAFAGDGRLRDGNPASAEFRELLANVASAQLQRYADQCLQGSFGDSGLVLQDVVNQIGHRLGLSVTEGRYRGSKGQLGHDGIWSLPSGHALVVEVKTTDVYRIPLDAIADYRHRLIKGGSISEDASSILMVVGREDTGDLEAQIRGSKHAWDIRLISVEALVRLMILKEEMEDPRAVRRIHEILIPREFTKLDAIIEVAFSAVVDVREEVIPEQELKDGQTTEIPKPVSFHQACIERLEQTLGVPLLKRSRTSYSSPDGSIALVCTVSKEYLRGGQFYWFAFHPYQKDFLESAKRSFIAFGCGSAATMVLLPWSEFSKWLKDLNITEKADRFYWHVHVYREDERFTLRRKRDVGRIDVTGFLVPDN